MKHVHDLIGTELDYWVSRAEGYPACDPTYGPMAGAFPSYSTDPAHGQPIMERERISSDFCGASDEWDAGYEMRYGDYEGPKSRGPTMLIAGMRAFVASRFGDTVPDEVPA